jgi:hypothetical protein
VRRLGLACAVQPPEASIDCADKPIEKYCLLIRWKRKILFQLKKISLKIRIINKLKNTDYKPDIQDHACRLLDLLRYKAGVLAVVLFRSVACALTDGHSISTESDAGATGYT